MQTLVLGGNGLLGSEIVKFLHIKGVDVIVGDIKKNKNLKNIPFFKVNLNNVGSLKKLVQDLNKKRKKISNIINCTYPQPKKFNKDPLNLNKNEFVEYFKTHLWSYNSSTRFFGNYFKKEKIRGHIINFASIYGIILPDFSIYHDYKIFTSLEYFLTKHNIILLSKYYAKYLKINGIRVNCISPGGINNDFEKKFVKKYGKKTMSKKMLFSKDLNGMVYFLLSNEAKKITGQNFVIDEGFTL